MRWSSASPARLAVALVCVAFAACRSTTEPPEPPAPGVTPPAIEKLEQERASADAFAPFLVDEEPAVRARASLALGRLEHRGTVPHLVPLLGDGDGLVRATAAFSLGQIDLALEPTMAGHAETRALVEEALAAALGRDEDQAVRRAIVRALGRVADGRGLRALVEIAASTDPLASEALTALGVSGARRQASLKDDAAFGAVIARALSSGDAARKTAAAYAAFRQKVPLDAGAVPHAWESEAQTRIFLVRAGASQAPPVRAELARRGLADPDWRVRVEALRIARADELDVVSLVLADATARVLNKETPAPALGHVVREACTALLGMETAPDRVLASLSKATAALLPSHERHRAAACTCAVAKDALEGDADDTRACAQGADDATIGKLNVQIASQRKVSSKERVTLLATLVEDDDTKVRMAAAGALAADESAAAGEVAHKRLAQETDPAVIAALLELFAAPAQAASLSDDRMFEVATRLFAGKSFEESEPLLAIAKLARTRDTQTAKAVVEKLKSHHHPSVRDVAAGIASGDRPPGPRARVSVVPRPSELPGWAVLKTSRGEIRIAFDTAHAPATVASFAALARAKLFDGTPFHRVIADFVAQGGDPRGDGSGGPGYSLACERSDEPFVRGAIGMAHAGLDTGGSQFFLTHSSQPHLDGRYTLFAHVVDGLDVMDAIQPDDLLFSVDFFSAAPRR